MRGEESLVAVTATVAVEVVVVVGIEVVVGVEVRLLIACAGEGARGPEAAGEQAVSAKAVTREKRTLTFYQRSHAERRPPLA